jgi:L-2-hydroxyglutarate oxidase LhgO
MVNHDVCIVGGGIIGLAVARELRRRLGRSIRLCVLEKETQCCTHGSGRNSGVLHAGFYYTADSLRARLCRDGNRRLTEYCDAHNIPLRRCGKLVVAQNEHELAGLDELLRRAALNGVELVRFM